MCYFFIAWNNRRHHVVIQHPRERILMSTAQ